MKEPRGYVCPVRFEDDFDDPDTLYTVDEFREDCENDWLIDDDDGVGHPAKDGLYDSGIDICPSSLKDIPEDATHIVWFNK